MSKVKMENRDTSRDYAEVIPAPRDITRRYTDQVYDKCLKIVLYGEPFSDSRPRINKQTSGVGNPNLSKMKKVFNQLYRRSVLLQNLTIVSPFKIELRAYMSPTINDRKYIKNASNRIKKAFESERLGNLAINDIDNMLKIHNDLLFSYEYRILLDDAWNTGVIESHKYLSNNPRAEFYVYYCSKPNNYSMWKIEGSDKYFRWIISEKHMKQHNRNIKEQFNHLKKVMQRELNLLKNENDVRKILKRFSSVLEEYPADLLKELAGYTATSRVFTKYAATLKLMFMLVKGFSIAETILKNGGQIDER